MNNVKMGYDKILVRVHSAFFDGYVEAKNMEYLKHACSTPCDIASGMHWKGVKIPAELFSRVLGTICAFPNTETAYVMYYNPKDRVWYIDCPPQDGKPALVQYKSEAFKNGCQYVGTIHSHPNMKGAFSSTDHACMDNEDGMHIVIGTKDGMQDSCTFAIFSDNGDNFEYPLSDIVENADELFAVRQEPFQEWVNSIKSSIDASANAHSIVSLPANWDDEDPDSPTEEEEISNITRILTGLRGTFEDIDICKCIVSEIGMCSILRFYDRNTEKRLAEQLFSIFRVPSRKNHAHNIIQALLPLTGYKRRNRILKALDALKPVFNPAYFMPCDAPRKLRAAVKAAIDDTSLPDEFIVDIWNNLSYSTFIMDLYSESHESFVEKLEGFNIDVRKLVKLLVNKVEEYTRNG